MYTNNYDPFGFQSPYFGDPFSSSYEHRRQQEVARHQILMDEERRRKAAHERRKRVEVEEQMAIEERQRRHTMETPQRKHNKMETMRRQRLEKKQPDGMSDSLPLGTIVRGPDGNLYRIAVPPQCERDDISESCPVTHCDRNLIISTKNKENAVVIDKPENGSPECNDSGDDVPLKNCPNNNHTYEVIDSVTPFQEDVLIPEIVVENVPDEEDDALRELRSVWRNRVPSPGQWMEPVESFCRSG
mmetsp:Transcript_20084/g.48287  ORF Transcript_20084/g.48287 Transcript_20084/m.48287 type:complete len:244 (-) Transcript_20084:1423-2154(-)